MSEILQRQNRYHEKLNTKYKMECNIPEKNQKTSKNNTKSNAVYFYIANKYIPSIFMVNMLVDYL